MTAFNFTPEQIALTLFHLSHIKSKSVTNSCFHSLIQRFVTTPNTLSNPCYTLPILHSINHSKIIIGSNSIIYKFITNILKPEIITQYLGSITDVASLIYLVDSLTRSAEHVGELRFDQLKVVISQVLDHYSNIDLHGNHFSDTEALASLVTLLTLGSYYGLDIVGYSTFLPLLLRIDVKKFPKYTLVDSLEVVTDFTVFDEYSNYLLKELSDFDDLNDYPRHLLQRILIISACRNWKNLKLLDNISRVLCETSHTNIGITSIVKWLESFKKLNYQNKSALELLLRQTLSIKGNSDKYPIVYQLFKDLQFDHFLLGRLQILAIHSNNSEEIDFSQTNRTVKPLVDQIPQPADSYVRSSSSKASSSKASSCKASSSSEASKPITDYSATCKAAFRPTKQVKIANESIYRRIKLMHKVERNRGNIARFWRLNYKKHSRKNVKDCGWRLKISGNIVPDDNL